MQYSLGSPIFISKDIIVVGSGLAGMACASYLAKNNHSVTVIEKNSTYGGRLQSISKNGYTFDALCIINQSSRRCGRYK